MQNTFLSLVPPFIALGTAFFSRRIVVGLVCGIATGALIATDWSIPAAIQLSVNRLIHSSDLWRLASWDAFWQSSNLFILIFLLALSIIIALISYAGGVFAYVNWSKKYIRSAKTAQFASMILSYCLCIDDYFSSLTVGSVMQPITDRYKIPRVKLSFLVDSLAAPVVILCPISSWLAGILGFLKEYGIKQTSSPGTFIIADPFFVYLTLLPFLFYPLVVLASTFFIVRCAISFGPMYQQEQIAHKTNNLFGGKSLVNSSTQETPQENRNRAQVIDFLVPVLFLIFGTIFAILGSGRFVLLGGHNGLFAALQQANAAKALFLSGTITVIFITIFFLARKRMKIRDIPSLYHAGIRLMMSTILMLICAWALGDILRLDLLTGQYIGTFISASSSSFFLIAPLLFLLALFIAFSIGSSWATMAIMLPIVIPIVVSFAQLPTPVPFEQVPLLSFMLGALFSGAVAGNHISPLADTTLMSARSAGAHLTDHVHAQLWYAVPMIIATTLGFFVASFMITYSRTLGWLCGITTSIGISILLLSLLNHVVHKKSIGKSHE